MMLTRLAFGCLVGLLLVPTPTFAGVISKTYGFSRITNNAAEDVFSQLTVVVSGDDSPTIGPHSATFTFYNAATVDSSITDIYFQDGTLLGVASISSSAGALFSQGASPGNLPAGNSLTPKFVTTSGLSFDSVQPVSSNGVDAATEWVSITFSLINSKTIVDTIAAMDRVNTVGAASIWDNKGAYLQSGVSALRIGIHVQSIGAGSDSDSFVSTDLPHAPEPTSFVTFSAMVALTLLSRRRMPS